MASIGEYNRLAVVKLVDFGAYLDGHELGEILLPKRYLNSGTKVGHFVDVFLYADSSDLLIATTERPLATVGQSAYLKVISQTRAGTYLDWGLMKDLLIPFNEQAYPMVEGRSYVVYIYLDTSTNRIAASTKLHHHLSENGSYFKAEQEVDLMIATNTDLGYKAVINNSHLGVLYKNEVFQPLRFGQKLRGYIKAIREDGRIDLALQLSAANVRDELEVKILELLKEQGGTSTITDKSPPDVIYATYKSSKANYKRALGRLYKKKLITIDKTLITLL